MKLNSTCTSCLAMGVAFLALQMNIMAEWSQYRGPGFNGGTIEVINIAKLKGKTVWKVATPNGFSSFSSAEGVAVTLVSRQDQDGLLRETCITLDATTGRQLWAVDLDRADYKNGGGNSGAKGNNGGDGPRSTPTIHRGKIYIYDADMNLYALDAKTGKEVWKKRILKEFIGREIKWKNAASPIIDGDLVIIAGGGAGQTYLAFHKDSGDLVWKSGVVTGVRLDTVINLAQFGARVSFYFGKPTE